jgi:hypothetical protein
VADGRAEFGTNHPAVGRSMIADSRCRLGNTRANCRGAEVRAKAADWTESVSRLCGFRKPPTERLCREPIQLVQRLCELMMHHELELVT